MVAAARVGTRYGISCGRSISQAVRTRITGNRYHTLNFRISDLYTRGRLLVYARVWTDSKGGRRYSPWFGRIFTFTTVPHVRIRAHGIHYQRGAIDRPAPAARQPIFTTRSTGLSSVTRRCPLPLVVVCGVRIGVKTCYIGGFSSTSDTT